MKQIKFLGVVALALSLGLAACNGGGNSKSSSKHTHTWGEYTQVKAATCTEKGSEKRVCSGCQQEQTRDIPALGHQFLEGDADVKTDVVPAGCETDGSYKHVCQRCQQTIQETVPATGHSWAEAADQSQAVAATCTEPGTKIEECANCHQTRSVEVEALGHDFPENGTKLPVPAATETNTKGEVPFHWAEITNYSCTRGDSYRYAWSAKEVNFDYEHEGVHWTEEEIAAAQEGDPAYGKTTADWKSEPNLLDDGEGIRFWGRPIGNAMVLSNEGRASSNNDEKIPDETVKGSRFEFDFVFDKDVNDVCLSAELTPAQYTNDIFKNRSGDQEWTPGYRFVDDDNDPSTPKVPEQIQGMRFIILLDGVEVDLDETVNTAPAGRKWYQFPCKLNLTAGKHNLNIAMAGGYLHTFYQFSFEKVPPAHKHNFATETKVDKKGDGYVDYYTATCAKDQAQQIRISAPDGTWTKGGNKSGTREGYIKPNANGDIISYKFDYAGQPVKAKLYQFGFMDGWAQNSGRNYTSIQNGQSVGPTGCNFGMKFNSVEVQIDEKTKTTPFSELLADATVDAGSSNSKAGPCLVGEVNLVAGDNTFEFQRYASYNLSISDFLLVIEA